MLAMRPNPEPEKLPAQSLLLRRICSLRRDGYGWEDICVKLRAEQIPVPQNQIKNFVLRPRS